MKFAAAIALLASVVHGHYVFPSITYGGVTTADWVDVRMTDNHWSNSPVTDVSSPEMTCYQATTNSTGVQTMDVRAGSTVNFNVKSSISHPGTLNVYMAKAPDGTSLSDFDGKGRDWFKIMEEGPIISATGLSWPTQGLTTVPIDLPTCLEDGEYLLRMEHIALHAAADVGGAQLYIACAQISVSGGTGSMSPNLMAFPGAYDPTDPGLVINIYYPIPTSYTAPGGSPLTC